MGDVVVAMAGIANPFRTKICQYFELTKLAEPAVVGKCVQHLAAHSHPVSSEGGLEKFVVKMPLFHTNSEEDIYMDKSFIMKKLIVDVSAASPNGEISTHMEMIDMMPRLAPPTVHISRFLLIGALA